MSKSREERSDEVSFTDALVVFLFTNPIAGLVLLGFLIALFGGLL